MSTAEPPPKAPERRFAPAGWRVTRFVGTSQPHLDEASVLSEAPVSLAADAELVVDRFGTRYRVFGPAHVAFGTDGVCLLAGGTFALTHVAGAPAAPVGPPGPRGPGARLALPDRVVTALGRAVAVGRADAAGSEVEVLGGAARVDPPGRVLRAGERLSARGATPRVTETRGERLEERVARLRAANPEPVGAALRDTARARLLQALRQLEDDVQVPPAPGADALSRRRALATQAAARIRARAGLADALDAFRAASLLSPRLQDEALIAQATARLYRDAD